MSICRFDGILSFDNPLNVNSTLPIPIPDEEKELT